MKFSEIGEAKWNEWRPYLDTCLLPVTGLTGKEEPWQATQALERLRDGLDELERRYTGRIVTYPALHYTAGGGLGAQLDEVCRNLKASAGFSFVVVLAGDGEAFGVEKPEAADLLLHTGQAADGRVVQLVSELWRKGNKLEINE